MKTFLALAVFGCSAVWAADITPLDVRMGQWETSVTAQMTGMPPIPQDLLDKMTPEQRARMEARMKANQGARTVVTKTCLRKEDMNKAMTFGADDKACTRTILTSTGSRQDIRVECNRPQGKETGTVHVEASDSEHIKGAVQMTLTQGERSMTVNSSFASKWLGSVCTEKDAK